MNTSFRVGDAEDAVKTNRRRFFDAAGVPDGAVATAGQVHGSNVVLVDRPGHYPDCDGLVTATPGLFLGVSIADCVPVLLYLQGSERNPSVVAAVHSGWRGSREGIARRAVELMIERFGADPAGIQAYIGPSAGGCCYEVGPEVAGHFPRETLVMTAGGKAKLDLQAYNRDLLAGAGVPQTQILVSGSCTIHEEDTFHSHRRDGERSGRMLAVIGLM
jgi:YfiH family protein